MLVSLGTVDDVRPKASEHGIDRVLLIEDFDVPRAFGVSGTPGAVVLDAHGRIASDPALGTQKVWELLGAWTEAPRLVQVEGAG